MEVKLKFISPLVVCSDAIRQCRQTHDKSDTGYFEINCALDDIADFHLDGKRKSIGKKDKALISRVGVKMKHESTLEHIVVSFDISGISRGLLQEWSRHRIMSQTVKSSRFTLGELKNEEPFISDDFEISECNFKRASKYLVWTKCNEVDIASIYALENLRKLAIKGIPNDKLKYCMPESMKTSLTCTINFRSLRNMLALRSDKSALLEFRTLVHKMFETIPEDYKFLLEDCLKEEK
jgi:thymidylate synthase (FAD)